MSCISHRGPNELNHGLFSKERYRPYTDHRSTPAYTTTGMDGVEIWMGIWGVCAHGFQITWVSYYSEGWNDVNAR